MLPFPDNPLVGKNFDSYRQRNNTFRKKCRWHISSRFFDQAKRVNVPSWETKGGEEKQGFNAIP
jgi:hypothetical protein